MARFGPNGDRVRLHRWEALARPAGVALLDPQHAELADQVAEDDHAVAGHQITPSECT
jgi:hypothetical protein